MSLPQALKILESEGRIDNLRSQCDNAISLIDSVLLLNLTDLVRASLVYALDVLKSDSTVTAVPVGLRPEQAKKTVSDNSSAVNDEDIIMKWLLSSYTPSSDFSAKSSKEKRTFRGTAQSIKFAIKLRGALGRRASMNEMYVFDTEPGEREAIDRALQNSKEWDWDVWHLHDVSHGRPLQALGWHILHEWDMVKHFKLDKIVLRGWLAFVEAQYQRNEYHSSTHAADVLQSVHFLLGACGAGEHLSSLSIFALLIAAMIHDAGHDGLNNLYHQNAMTSRALLFNDQSVQENYHCMTIFTSMARDPAINILASFDAAQAKEVRRQVRDSDPANSAGRQLLEASDHAHRIKREWAC